MTFEKHMKTYLLCCAFALAIPGLSAAQDQDTALKTFANKLPDTVKKQIARRPDFFLRNMANIAFNISPDGIVTAEAIELFNKRTLAQNRVREITRILGYDLDGDGSLSAAEIAQQLPYLQSSQRGDLTVTILENDTNDDGALSFKEILAAADKKVNASNRGVGRQQGDLLMAFDYNGDGKVDLTEISKVLAAIDPASLVAARPTQRNVSPSSATCKIPTPKDDAEVVFLSGYEGAAVSTLAVSGQDVETSVATITIKEGLSPLYIFATAYDSIIWKFEGATERVRHLIVQPRTISDGPGAAVAGIEQARITFVPPRACIDRFVTQRGAKSRVRIDQLTLLLGGKIDHLVLSYTLDNLQVPPSVNQADSGPKTHPYRTPVTFSIGEHSYELSAKGMFLKGDKEETSGDSSRNQSLIRQLMRYYPGGLIPLSSADVYAEKEIQPYAVLPQEAGVLQLMAEGSIEYDRGTYIIKKPITRFPAGLNGAHLKKFILGTGVPMPAGSPGHSSVISEETGECLTRLPCR